MLCPHPMSVMRPGQYNAKNRLNVPCGVCPVCLNNRRMEWAYRILEESKGQSSLFITLTYSDENLYYNSSSGHLCPSVDKRTIQLFIKLLRYKLNKKIRYYAVGEYGTNTFRPHYHIMLFNVDRNDCSRISDCWRLGYVYFGELTIQSALYVAKFHVNKTNFPVGCTPSFVLMSLRPGIGYKYVEKMHEFHAESIDRCYYPDFEKKLRLPRYYREKVYTSKQREQIQEKFEKEIYDLEKVKTFEKKNKESYFKNRFYAVKNFEDQFKNKSNFNNKI